MTGFLRAEAGSEIERCYYFTLVKFTRSNFYVKLNNLVPDCIDMPTAEPPPSTASLMRERWIARLSRLAGPVLSTMAEDRLRASMPCERPPRANEADGRAENVAFAALARALAGLGPWLETAESETCRSAAAIARRALAVGFDPSADDYMLRRDTRQLLVEMAFLALAFARAPAALWEASDAKTRARAIETIERLRSHKPWFNNWLLFPAMTEAWRLRVGADCDPMRIDLAVRQFDQWYIGDGYYRDGPDFHLDYYNSYVIHPMMRAISDIWSEHDGYAESMRNEHRRRAHRHAETLERMVGSDGGFPAVGRSVTYRCGAFHLLADLALRDDLPETLSPARVRAALDGVMAWTLDREATYDGPWLTLGLTGRQPELSEPYLCTGSMYLCSTALLPLGLSAGSFFWTDPPDPTTWRRLDEHGGPDHPAS